MSLEVECKVCSEEFDMRHGSCPSCWWAWNKRIPQLESLNAELVEALEELQKGIYDFTELPIYAKNFVHRITSEALAKARGES